MTQHEQIEQQLWELVYDLLPEDEAADLRERICSEPELARAYAAVKLRTEAVGAAAKLDDSDVQLRLPADLQTADSPSYRRSGWTTARKALALAAALLIAVIGYGTSKLAELGPATADAKPVVATLTLPPYLSDQISNTVLASTADESGRPLVTELEYRFYDQSGAVQLTARQRTDQDGRTRIQLPTTDDFTTGRLEVNTVGNADEVLSTHLARQRPAALTHLSIDKPFYEPGELVLFRSVTLSKFNLTADEEVEVYYHLEAPDGSVVADSRQQSRTELGVGTGSFPLPQDTSPGNYAVVAQAANSDTSRQEFFVQPEYRVPTWKQEIELGQESYSPGDLVSARIEITDQSSGEPVAGLDLNYQVFVGGQQLNGVPASGNTDAEGQARLEVQLPAAVQQMDGMIVVTASGGNQQESFAKALPIHEGDVDIAFFPEGGNLAAGVPNRVYFDVRDTSGQPVHLEARVVDQQGTEIPFATEQDGLGLVTVTPSAEAEYRIEIDRPLGAATGSQFPSIDESPLTMNTGSGVFTSDQSLSIVLHARQPIGPVIIAASCRQTVVGLERVEDSEFRRGAQGMSVQRELKVADETAGVVRVTAYDYSVSPPVPLAERLVYCRPLQKVEIGVEGLAARYTSGQRVELSVVTRDENAVPQDVAMGVSVVDAAVLRLAEDEPTSLTDFFYLHSAIDRVSELEDADFYLTRNAGAEQALDLLLGTQGWREFTSTANETSGQVGGGGLLIEPLGVESTRQFAAVDTASFPRIIKATLNAAYGSARREQPRQRLPLIRILLPLLAVVTLVALLTLAITVVRRHGQRPLWFTVAVASALLVLTSPLWLRRSLPRVGRLASTTATAERSDDDAAPRRASKQAEFEPAESTGGSVAAEAEQLAVPTADDSVAGELPEQRAAPAKRGRTFFQFDETDGEAQQPSAKAATDAEAASAPDRMLRANQEPPSQPPAVVQNQEARLEAGDAMDATAPGSAGQARFKSAAGSGTGLTRRFADRRLLEELNRTLVGGRQSEDTILWLPFLRAGVEGRQAISFDLPDRPARFRLRIDAHGSGRLGSFATDVVSE